MTDALREACAAMAKRMKSWAGTWPDPSPLDKDLRDAGELFSTLALQEPAPVVAREPTPKMMLAGATALYGEEEARDQACRDAAADCWYAMYNAAPQAPVEPAPVVQPLPGHGAPCYYCAQPCSSLAGNPGLWPVALCHADEPGVVKWHHTGCVEERLSAAPSQLVEDARAKAARDVLAERQRQIEAEGWTPAHDDEHTNGTLSEAAACYITGRMEWSLRDKQQRWPFDEEWWKPKDRRSNLVRAGALILAEIERIDRYIAKGKES